MHRVPYNYKHNVVVGTSGKSFEEKSVVEHRRISLYVKLIVYFKIVQTFWNSESFQFSIHSYFISCIYIRNKIIIIHLNQMKTWKSKQANPQFFQNAFFCIFEIFYDERIQPR